MDSIYTYNTTDYDFVVRLYNGIHDVYLKPEAWEDLIIEEDIFDWKIKGSIVVNAAYETFERESDEALQFGDATKMVYKFRNDGRDTIYFYIMPKSDSNVSGGINGDFKQEVWGIEIEATIYDSEDIDSKNINTKIKKLYFWEKTYQMMLEKNTEFTTATVGDNKNKTDVYKLNNEDRSLKTGQALGELIINDEDFQKHADLYADEENWNMGDDKNKILYTSPTNSKFIDDVNYILSRHTSTESEKFQPCIFKFERATQKNKPKQFSLMSIKKYFEKAGKESPGDYQIEHLILEEFNEEQNPSVPIIKVPQQDEASRDVNKNVTAEDYSVVKVYKIVDFSGLDNSKQLYNRFISSFNDKKGQFNIEIKEHKTEKYKDFFIENIVPNILTEESEERMPLTPYIQKGYNASYHYSTFQSEQARIVDGRNKLLKYFMFSNIGISFACRGMTIRQPGRFFGLARNTKNDKEYDHKLEGQYFITNVIHHFNNANRSYNTQMVGIKTHTYKEINTLKSDDVIIIS